MSLWGADATHPFTFATVPRCTQAPGAFDRQAEAVHRAGRALTRGRWECGLPAGHQTWPDADPDGAISGAVGTDLRRFQRHAWSQTEG